MALQSSIKRGVNIGPEGAIARSDAFNYRVIGIGLVAGEDLPHGRVVGYHATEANVIVPIAAGLTVAGIALSHSSDMVESFESRMGISTPRDTFVTKKDSTPNILEIGDFWGYVTGACKPGDPVYYREVAGTDPEDTVGRFATAAGAGLVLLPQARIGKQSTLSGLTIIELGGVK